MFSFSNDFANINHYKTSIKGRVQDFIIKFNEMQYSIENVVGITSHLFQCLISSFDGKRIKARLIAKVNFTQINPSTGEDDDRSYYFPSYSAEGITYDAEEFFIRHMTKISSRLDFFNTNGSNLIIKNIEQINIQLSIF